MPLWRKPSRLELCRLDPRTVWTAESRRRDQVTRRPCEIWILKPIDGDCGNQSNDDC